MRLTATKRWFNAIGAAVALMLISSLMPPEAKAATEPITGGVSKPASFEIAPPWANGVEHTITQAYNSGLHKNTASSCCNNDYYALDVDMKLGEPIFSIAAGRVVYAGAAEGSWASFGNIVFIDHNNGFQSIYAHLNTVDVVANQTVDTQTPLGETGGSGGWSPHLHFAVYQGAQFINTVGAAGQYGGRSMVPEPFANCVQTNGLPCENHATGNRLRKGTKAVQAQSAVQTAGISRDSVSLRWAPPVAALQYQIQVIPLNNDGPGIDVVVSDPTQVLSGSYSIPQPVLGQGNYFLLPGASYSWRVRHALLSAAVLGAGTGWGAWSELQGFRTEAPRSGSLTILTPGVTTDSTPAVSWRDEDASNFYYEVQMSADPYFGSGATAVAPVYWNLVHGGQTSPLNSWTVPAGYELTPGEYYVRVRQRLQATPAGAAEPGISWSPAARFTVLAS